MVENHAEKVDECPLIRVVEYCLRTIGNDNCPLYRVVGCPLFRDCLGIERQSGLSELSVIWWVFTVEGCPLTGVPLYSRHFKPRDFSKPSKSVYIPS